MSLEHAFRADVLAYPEDDTPRLVYADWLEERADPRGTFIRLQMDLSRMADDDPRRPEWEFRVEELLGKHEEEWLGSLGGWAKGWRWVRGFVEGIEARAHSFLAHAEELFDHSPIRHARLTHHSGWVFYSPLSVSELHADPPFAADLAACPFLSRLRVLDLGNAELAAEENAALAKSSHLPEALALDLSLQVELSVAHVEMLLHSPLGPRLTALSLAHNRLGGPLAAVLAACRTLPRLIALDLTDCELDGPDLEALAGAPWLPQLTALHLGNNPFPMDVLPPLLAALGRPTLLDLSAGEEYRSIDFIRSIDLVLRVLAACPRLDRLTALKLDGNLLNADGLLELIVSNTLPALRALSLSGCGLLETHMSSLRAGLQKRRKRGLSDLVALSLGNNRIRGDGLKVLVKCRALDRLVALGLNDARIRDGIIKHLATTSHLPRLAALDLGRNPLGLPGAQVLAASHTLKQLAIVNLGEYKGSDPEIVQTLTRSHSLPWLRRVTHSGRMPEGFFPVYHWWAFPTQIPFRGPEPVGITED